MVSLLSSPIKPHYIESAESEYLVSLRNGISNIPASVWSRLYRALKPYLRPPGLLPFTRLQNSFHLSHISCAGDSGEEGVLDFFHQQLSFAVEQRYLSNEGEQNMRRAIHARVRTSNKRVHVLCS